MVTSLNSATPGRDVGYLVEQMMRKVVLFTDTSAVVVGGLPANALITGGQVSVSTAFSGTTPVINVGFTDATASSLSAYASAQAVATAGTATMNAVLTSGALPLSRATTVVASVLGTTMAAGACEVVLRFVVGP
jgi:hypothetical protein